MIKTRTIIDVALCDLNTGQIPWLPKNPRQWSKTDLDRTVASLQEDPDWIEDKPLSVVPYHNEAGELRYCVFCGNLRNSAQKELGIEKTPAFIYDPDAPDVGHEKEKRTPEQIETDRETIRRRAIKDNGTFGSWDSDELANWGVEPEQLLGWGVPDWVMGGAGTGAESKSNSRAAGEGDTPSEPAGLKLQAEFNSEEELFEAIDWLNLHGGKNVTRV